MLCCWRLHFAGLNYFLNLVWILLLWVGLLQFRMSRFRETSVPSKNLWSRWKVIWKTVRSPQWKETSSQKSWRYPLFFPKYTVQSSYFACILSACDILYRKLLLVSEKKNTGYEIPGMAMSVLKHFKSWQINNNFLSVK